jgi:hypothetical protein
MDADVTRAMALIAYRLASGSDATVVQDQADEQKYRFTGEVGASSLNLTDLSESARINGKGAAGVWNLFHTGSRSRLQFELSGSEFKGHDDSSGTRFTGSVSGSTVVVRGQDPASVCTYVVT